MNQPSPAMLQPGFDLFPSLLFPKFPPLDNFFLIFFPNDCWVVTKNKKKGCFLSTMPLHCMLKEKEIKIQKWNFIIFKLWNWLANRYLFFSLQSYNLIEEDHDPQFLYVTRKISQRTSLLMSLSSRLHRWQHFQI